MCKVRFKPCSLIVKSQDYVRPVGVTEGPLAVVGLANWSMMIHFLCKPGCIYNKGFCHIITYYSHVLPRIEVVPLRGTSNRGPPTNTNEPTTTLHSITRVSGHEDRLPDETIDLHTRLNTFFGQLSYR